MGWGSNEADLANMMRYIAPRLANYASLRAPLTLQAAGTFTPGAYSWFMIACRPVKTSTATRSPHQLAIDDWVSQNVPEDRAVVPIGFSQGGLLAIHLLRMHPERYRASISLSGFLAPGLVRGTPPLTVSRRSIFPRSSVTATAIR